MTGGRFVVCVPARNERNFLPNLLDSLSRQSCDWSRGRVIVVANNCTDDTVAVAAQFHGRLPVSIRDLNFAPAQAHVGTARKAALDEGCAWLSGTGDEGILLTTDADAIVPTSWVASNIAALEYSDLVGGRLVPVYDDEISRLVPLEAAIDRYWASVRAIEDLVDPQAHDPAPRHGDHTGASLGFRLALYKDLGGLRPLPTREDADFVQRAVMAGARLRHCPNVFVRVSARTAGRAAGGMAAEMARRHDVIAGARCYLLPHPDIWVSRIAARAAMRKTWGTEADIARALSDLGVAAADIAAIVANCPNAIACVERTTAALPPDERPPIDVYAALDMFDVTLAAKRVGGGIT